MNKHKILVYVSACALLVTSFVCWTYLLRWSFESLAAHVVVVTERYEVVSAEPEVMYQKPQDTVLEVPVANHAAAPLVVPLIAASVTDPVPPIITSIADPVPAVAIDKETEELAQWEIHRAWTIAIPSLGIRAPVLLPSMKYWSSRSWEMLEEQMQTGLSYGTVAYPHSKAPGENGSLIIAGHSSPPDERAKESDFGSVFERVPQIVVGEDIVVTRGGKQIHYTVESTDIVSPEATTILAPSFENTGILKIITCYPVGTSKSRFVVTARMKEDVAEDR